MTPVSAFGEQTRARECRLLGRKPNGSFSNAVAERSRAAYGQDKPLLCNCHDVRRSGQPEAPLHFSQPARSNGLALPKTSAALPKRQSAENAGQGHGLRWREFQLRTVQALRLSDSDPPARTRRPPSRIRAQPPQLTWDEWDGAGDVNISAAKRLDRYRARVQPIHCVQAGPRSAGPRPADRVGVKHKLGRVIDRPRRKKRDVGQHERVEW